MTCLWVVETEADARAWAGKMRGPSQPPILELRLAGKLLRCDAGWLVRDTNSPFSRNRADAGLYWSGEPCPAKPQPEILFEGEAQVVAALPA
jgi:hypothetical protein